MLTDVDRLLGSVLEADGPQSVPPGLVDAALVEVRAVDQRRPLLPALDQFAWPPLAGPRSRPTTRRVAAIALLVLLAMAATAAVVLVGTARPPQVLGDGQRAYVWLGDTAVLFANDGATEHRIAPGRRSSGQSTSCPTLVAGTTAVARSGFGGWDLVDVLTDLPVSSVRFNTAGMERWSPDARRMAIMDAAGRVGVVTFEDPAAPTTTWSAVSGVQWLAWSLDGERLAMLAQLDTDLVIDVLDVVTGDRQEVHRQRIDTTADFGQGPRHHLHWSSDGTLMALQVAGAGVAPSITLVDTASGATNGLEGIAGAPDAEPFLVDGQVDITADGSAFAVVSSPTEILITDARGVTLGTVATTQPADGLAWSADGGLLAFHDGDALVVVARDGMARRDAPVGTAAAFRWDSDGPGLIVATARTGDAAVERFETDTLTPVARLDSPGLEPGASAQPAPSAVDGQAAPICLQLDAPGPSRPDDP